MDEVRESVSRMIVSSMARVPEMTTDILVRGRPTVTYGEIVYPAGSTYGPLVQPTIELGLVHTGTMTFWIDGVRHEAAAGSACLLLPGHHHRFAFSSSSRRITAGCTCGRPRATRGR